MTNNALVIAVDGPSGSGKSSVARKVAAAYGLAYLDTGAMYRAAAWWCLHNNVNLDDAQSVQQTIADLPLNLGLDPQNPTVVVDGHDVAAPIRDPQISAVVSKVATNLPARALLVARQQELVAAEQSGGYSQGRGVVAEGRDITTVVAPDAQVRMLLTASAQARLARRAKEVHGEASAQALAATTDQVLRRDRDDATVSNFEQAAPGVVTIDSSDLNLDQTVQAAIDVVVQQSGRRP